MVGLQPRKELKNFAEAGACLLEAGTVSAYGYGERSMYQKLKIF